MKPTRSVPVFLVLERHGEIRRRPEHVQEGPQRKAPGAVLLGSLATVAFVARVSKAENSNGNLRRSSDLAHTPWGKSTGRDDVCCTCQV